MVQEYKQEHKMKIKDCVMIEPFKCNENDSVIEIAKKLKEITLRHIFVVNDDDYPVGIISMTDINNRIVAEGKNPADLKAKDIMSAPVDVADYENDIGNFSKIMIQKNHVMDPVVRDGKMIGIITVHQLLKNINENE